ncbi:MAG: SDR family NAD(P)-dependent oxidoreductase, partial [Polyangiales bacterium]
RASPDRAMVPALLSAVPHERRSVTVRHVDLALDGDAAARIAREVVTAETCHEVAWRDGRRYVSAIAPLDLTAPDRRPLPFGEGASHVVVGGLGGIGEILCNGLLSRWKGHLLVLGRTAVDVAHASDAWGRLSQRARVAGASLRYASVDVTDGAALDAATREFEGALGRAIDGLWHLAGRFDERTLEATDEAGLKAALAPQVEGARAIEALLATRPAAMLVAFASVHGQVGGFTLGPYAAASRYLQAWVRERRAAGHARSWCLAWSQWDDTGMNRASPRGERARAKGFLPVTPTRAWTSLVAALTHDHDAVLIGLDDRNGNIARRLVAPPALPLREIDARVVGEVTRRAEARDRFGARASVALRRVASLTGEVAAPEAPQGPVDEVERRVAAIWCAALGRDRVGVRENFFDLGGHSLLLAQVQQELTRAFGREVAMVELFRRPTVHALAAWLRAPVEARVEAAVDRGKLQRAAMEQQRAARAKARKS